jgi:hypothetical protein
MKHEYEINKALKETGVSLDRLKKAFHDDSTMLVSSFMWNLAKHLHGEAFPSVLSQLRQDATLDKHASLPESSGNPSIDKALLSSGLNLKQAKDLAFDFHIGSGTKRQPYISLLGHMCRNMSAEVATNVMKAWAKQIDDSRVVTASSKWIAKNCKFVRS